MIQFLNTNVTTKLILNFFLSVQTNSRTGDILKEKIVRKDKLRFSEEL